MDLVEIIQGAKTHPCKAGKGDGAGRLSVSRWHRGYGRKGLETLIFLSRGRIFVQFPFARGLQTLLRIFLILKFAKGCAGEVVRTLDARESEPDFGSPEPT